MTIFDIENEIMKINRDIKNLEEEKANPDSDLKEIELTIDELEIEKSKLEEQHSEEIRLTTPKEWRI